jgi:MerR family transcriptional regulator, thiopeptide resistance regulator
MKTYTVNQLAQLAGISVRALHHYDEIGLLKPAFTGENRYRYYGEDELLRLQQILIHRELDIPLAEIAALLDAPGFDRLAALQEQRERLEEQAKRYARMVKTIDRTIARLKGDRAMKDADLYSGVVSPEKQAEYETWLQEKYGKYITSRIEESRRHVARLSGDDWAALMADLAIIEGELAAAKRAGLPPQSAALDPLVSQHRDWVASMWGQPAPLQAYAGLADIYLAHPDFIARYEQIETGFAQYLATAMRSWVKRQAD